MEKKLITMCVILGFSLTFTAASYATITLDADALAAGWYTDAAPLVFATALGNVSFVGQIRDRDSDPEFNAAGASGNVFNVNQYAGAEAELSWDFYVPYLSFIYGGNSGGILVEARDGDGNVLDSFYQADTAMGQPAGPVVLQGDGIRSLYWKESNPDYQTFAALDNISNIPAPGAILLGSIGVGLVGWLRRRRTL